MNPAIEAAIAEYLRAKQRLLADLESTPEDRVSWAPSESSRTPIELVVHAAMGTEGMHGVLTGKPFPFADMAELDAFSREKEKEFTTREQAIALLDQVSDAYVEWMATLTDEQLAENFSMGPMNAPFAYAITFCADHLRCHASQLEYLQTIYGDREMHTM